MRKYIVLVALTVTFQYVALGQSLTGLQGLIVTPSAEMHPNGTFILGGSYFDHHNFEYGEYTYNGVAGYVAVTFLPFVELSFRYTSELRTISRENGNFPDRMPSFRIQFLKEQELLPSMAIGMHDISSVAGGGAKHFEASYIVFTKNLAFHKLHLKLNSGYGLGLLSAKHHEIKGVFAGMSLAFNQLRKLEVLLEYDSRDINTGVKLLLWDHLQLMAVARQCQYLEGSIAFRTTMK